MIRLLLALSFGLAISQPASAHGPGNFDRQFGDWDLRECSRDIQRHGGLRIGGNRFYSAKPPVRVLQCGETITSSVTLAADLNCPDTTGFALLVSGDNVVLNGNGKKIIAPQAAAGLFVQGANNSVKDLRINGTATYGILAYDSPGVKIYGNDTSGNQIGIMLYSENRPISSAFIYDNRSKNNAVFGIRTGFDGAGDIVSPSIKNNDLGASGAYALYVKASSFELASDHRNEFDGSTNGIYLQAGSFRLRDFSLKYDYIQKVGIFVDSAQNVDVKNVDVSSRVPASLSQERMGMDFYRVSNFTVQNLTAQGCDVGLKLETEAGVSPQGSVRGSRFLDNTVAGVMIVSYDQTPYGVLRFTDDCFRQLTNFLVETGTEIGLGSILDDSGSCRSCGR